MRGLLKAVIVGSLLFPSYALAGSIAVTPGSGTTVGAGSDGTNQIPATILCGASATATLYAVCVNQAIVNASGQLLTLDSQSGAWNITNITGTITLPTLAATSTLQTTGNSTLTTINTSLGTINTSLGTINTTLGTPMQNSGGSVTANAGTNLNTSALATSANLTSGTQKTQIVDGSGNVIASTNNALNVNGGVIQTGVSVPINISTATTTLLVAASGSTQIYVTSFNVVAAGTGNITLEYGTGSSCTGTHALTGPYNLTPQAGVSTGSGLGPILITPASQALCAVTSNAVQMSGSLSYNQQ